jgi:hypothetical protein
LQIGVVINKEYALNTTKAVGLGSVAFSLLLLTQTKELPSAALRLPSLLIWIIIALSALMIIEDIFKQKKECSTITSSISDEPNSPINWKVLCVFSCSILVYIALIPIVGYLLTTPAFVIAGLIASKSMSVTKSIAIGILTTVVIWLVFIWLLKLPIPLFAWQN